MKQYDFDTVTERLHTDSMKWNVGENELPMWVADMDFKVAEEIREALEKRLRHGIFGYSCPSSEWAEAYIGWWRRRHGIELEHDWLMFTEGIVPAVASAIRRFSQPGENVLLQTPVYNHFFYSVQDTGRVALESPLHYENGVYSMDFERLENDLANPLTTLMILCNPQNPTGNLWDRETLSRIGELAHKHHVLILVDEIHCDVTDPGLRYTPFVSVSPVCRDNCIMFMSPTKCFNIAGIKTACVCVPNPDLRHKMWRAMKTDEIMGVNFFALDAAKAAFNEGEPWLDACLNYIYENKKLVEEYIRCHIPLVTLVRSQATYLLWIDCSRLAGEPVHFNEWLRKKTGLFLSDGGQFGKAGDHFLRMNIACPRTLLVDGLERLRRGVELWQECNK